MRYSKRVAYHHRWHDPPGLDRHQRESTDFAKYLRYRSGWSSEDEETGFQGRKTRGFRRPEL